MFISLLTVLVIFVLLSGIGAMVQLKRSLTSDVMNLEGYLKRERDAELSRQEAEAANINAGLKKAAVIELNEWVEREKVRLRVEMGHQREALKQETAAAHGEQLKKLELDMTEKKRAAVAELEDWVEQEMARLRAQFEKNG